MQGIVTICHFAEFFEGSEQLQRNPPPVGRLDCLPHEAVLEQVAVSEVKLKHLLRLWYTEATRDCGRAPAQRHIPAQRAILCAPSA